MGKHSLDELRRLLETVEAWYERTPRSLSVAEQNEWVQSRAEIACPDCGGLLFLLRTTRAQSRGTYKLVICQNPDCSFQADDDVSFRG